MWNGACALWDTLQKQEEQARTTVHQHKCCTAAAALTSHTGRGLEWSMGKSGYFGCVLAKLSITPFSSALHFLQQVSRISDVTLLRKGRWNRVERVWTRTSKHSETHRGPLGPHFLRKGLFNLTVSPASIQSLHPSPSASPYLSFCLSHTILRFTSKHQLFSSASTI